MRLSGCSHRPRTTHHHQTVPPKARVALGDERRGLGTTETQTLCATLRTGRWRRGLWARVIGNNGPGISYLVFFH